MPCTQFSGEIGGSVTLVFSTDSQIGFFIVISPDYKLCPLHNPMFFKIPLILGPGFNRLFQAVGNIIIILQATPDLIV
jgi:hypothetical protein